ncbi:MAG: DUF2723 domain-containing protein [Candidatus Firestonebacteria bacterium]
MIKKYFSVLIFIITFFVYLLTASPTVYVGDSGELISAAYVSGIPHPPGYPLFCMLGKLFTYFPLGTIAFRVNLVAAFFGSLTILILFLSLSAFFTFHYSQAKACDYQTSSPINPAPYWYRVNWYAFFASLFFAFSRAFWSQCLMAKGALYIINVFFLILIIYFLVYWSFDRKKRYLCLASFFYGLCLTNHHISLGFFPAFIIFIFLKDKSVFKNYKLLFKMFFLFLLGLSLYLYLPLMASYYPLINNGNPVSLNGMLEHILRKQYGSLSKNPHSLELAFNQVKYSLLLIIEQFPLWIICLPILGLIGIFKKFKELFVLTIILFFTIIFGIVFGMNFDITPVVLEVNKLFYIPLYLIIAIWLFFGVCKLCELIKLKFFNYALLVFLILGVIILICNNYKFNDKSKNYLAYEYGVNTLKVCKENAVIFASEDTPLYQLAYLQFVEKVRPDVAVCDENGTAFRTILTEDDIGIVYKQTLRKRVNDYLIRVLNEGKSVYHTMESSLSINPNIRSTPSGILYKVVKAQEVSETFWKTFKIPENRRDYDIFNRDMIARYHLFLGEYYFSLNKKEQAIKECNLAGEIGFDMDWLHHEIGIVYSRNGLKEEYLKEMEISTKLYRFSFERRNNLGNAYLSFGRINEAIKEFEMAIKLSPEIPAPHHNLANAYLSIGRRKDAKKEYLYAAGCGQIESFGSLAQLYIEDKEFDKALNIYTELYKVNPENFDACNGIGLVYEKQGKINEALQIYKNIVSLKPDYIFAYINMGNIYLNNGKFDDAILEYKKVWKYNPDFPEAYYNIGVAYHRKGNLIEAGSMWKKTLELNPNHTGARNAIKK